MQRVPRAIWLLAGAVLAVAAVFAFDLTPWVRGGFGWRWEYDPLPLPLWLLPLLLFTVYIGGAYMLLKRAAPTGVLSAWSVVFAIALALSVTAAHEGDAIYGLFARTVSKLATGAHWLSVQVDWAGGGWREWTDVMREAGGHLSNLPPGLPMAYAGLTGIFGAVPGVSQTLSGALLPYQCHNPALLAYAPPQIASASFGVLMPLWAALAVFPLAAVARRLSGEDAARCSVLWWPLTPALLAFAGSLNTIYPLFTLAALYALIRALDTDFMSRRLGWALLSGVISGCATFANFAFVPLPLVLGLFALIYGLSVKKRPLFQLVVLGLVYALGLLLIWIAFALATGLTPLDILRASFEFHLDLDRPYAFWVAMHLWDWLVWGGLALGILTVFGVWRARRDLNGGAALGLALAAGMVILALSGTARGETGRVWLVFTPLLALGAADALRRLAGEPARLWALVAVPCAALALVLTMSLPVVGIDLTPPPVRDTSTAARPADALFSDGETPVFRLAGWDTAYANGALDVSLTFEAQGRIAEMYYLGGVLVLPDGTRFPVTAQQPHGADGTPVPATCWPVGTPVTVHMDVPVPVGAASSGAYLSVAVYGATEGDGALTVTSADGESSQIGLGPFPIGE